MKDQLQKSPPCASIYGLGVVGAAVYYINMASSFGSGLLGLLKALVWPALLVYELLRMTGA